MDNATEFSQEDLDDALQRRAAGAERRNSRTVGKSLLLRSRLPEEELLCAGGDSSSCRWMRRQMAAVTYHRLP